MTDRILSLAQLIALPYAPPRMVQLAAAAGCGAVGLRLAPAAPGGVAYALMDDAPLLRETLAVLRDTGVCVFDIEMVRLNARFSVSETLPLLDAGAQLGALHLLVAGDDPDEERTIVSFAALCEAAARFGLSANLEFMPWTEVRDLAGAQRVVAAAAQCNGAVLVDALHFARSASRIEDLAAMPRTMCNYAQLCDGPVPGPTTPAAWIHAARCERLLPGEGGIDLVGLLRAMPRDLPISIEVPSDARAPRMGYLAWAKLAIAATRAVLEKLP